jgi:hypothetical protein
MLSRIASPSGKISDTSDGSCWDITGVYGPQHGSDKNEFMQELRDLKL